MSAGAWTAVAALIAVAGVGLTALGAWITAKGTRKASPYEALAKRVTDLEIQRAEDVRKIEEQQVQIAALKARDGQAQSQIAGLERRVSAVINDRDGVITYLIQFREWVARGSKPPVPPIPLHLRDVIPDWAPDDDDRSTDVAVRRGPDPEPAGP